jgi:hypothetical protein
MQSPVEFSLYPKVEFNRMSSFNCHIYRLVQYIGKKQWCFVTRLCQEIKRLLNQYLHFFRVKTIKEIEKGIYLIKRKILDQQKNYGVLYVQEVLIEVKETKQLFNKLFGLKIARLKFILYVEAIKKRDAVITSELSPIQVMATALGKCANKSDWQIHIASFLGPFLG